MGGSFIVNAFADKSMIAQIVAVVAGKDDHSIFEKLFFRQCRHDATNLKVNLLDRCRIVGTYFLNLTRGESAVVDAVPRRLVAFEIVLQQLVGIAGRWRDGWRH